MIPNNNLNVLPFYSSLAEQNHRKPHVYGDIHPLISGSTKILPFQINRETRGNGITSVQLINHFTGVSQNITAEAQAAGLHIKPFAAQGYDLIVNNSALIFPSLVLDKAAYYLRITDGVDVWFSEIFTVVNDLTPYLKIEYWDKDAIAYTGGHIDYTAPYKNYCYIKTEIGKPEYPFEEKAQKRDGYIFIETQISEKKYKFEFLAPEYLCDALRAVRLHDYINIYFRGKKYAVENIIFDPKWKEQGNIAVMEVEFECDTIIKKVGRGAVTTSGGGSFNADFNNDFNN
ncbi:hypothetical protein B620_gp24 [Croceibacter phage P2559S]|uniref:hypothetical protein n=1 Tax=Croceibacter phage P2559S TaxID=1176422 RepID=UPI0002688EB3|nr:hypothetical protein B620_gp24 [Croceibacter phage P2559S]AFM54802.1 hypothetical protein P2559S_24 [Croceibacter phage P2559S]